MTRRSGGPVLVPLLAGMLWSGAQTGGVTSWCAGARTVEELREEMVFCRRVRGWRFEGGEWVRD